MKICVSVSSFHIKSKLLMMFLLHFNIIDEHSSGDVGNFLFVWLQTLITSPTFIHYSEHSARATAVVQQASETRVWLLGTNPTSRKHRVQSCTRSRVLDGGRWGVVGEDNGDEGPGEGSAVRWPWCGCTVPTQRWHGRGSCVSGWPLTASFRYVENPFLFLPATQVWI